MIFGLSRLTLNQIIIFFVARGKILSQVKEEKRPNQGGHGKDKNDFLDEFW